MTGTFKKKFWVLMKPLLSVSISEELGKITDLKKLPWIQGTQEQLPLH